MGVRNERRPVIGEQRRDRRAEQHDQREELAALALAPARDVQRRPFKEPGFVEQQADDDDRDEGGSRVPDDVPDDGDVVERNNAREQRNCRASNRTPADAQPLGLPDDKGDRQQEDQNCSDHQGIFLGCLKSRSGQTGEAARG